MAAAAPAYIVRPNISGSPPAAIAAPAAGSRIVVVVGGTRYPDPMPQRPSDCRIAPAPPAIMVSARKFRPSSADSPARRATVTATTRNTEIRAACRSEEHTSELQSLMRISYAVFCLKKKKKKEINAQTYQYYNHTTTKNEK